MPKSPPYKIVRTQPKSELEQFAGWFHQDWKLVFNDFYAGAEMYFATLASARKEVLREELATFLQAHSSADALKRSWLRSGAQGWQENLDIRKTLAEFLRML
jgi:hypothetical protein